MSLAASSVRLELDVPGQENMNRDVQLLDAAEKGNSGARVYTWSKLCVSLGRNQNPERALLNTKKIDWVMRPTGGKAVLHGHDLTVSLIVTSIWDVATRSIRKFTQSQRSLNCSSVSADKPI